MPKLRLPSSVQPRPHPAKLNGSETTRPPTPTDLVSCLAPTVHPLCSLCSHWSPPPTGGLEGATGPLTLLPGPVAAPKPARKSFSHTPRPLPVPVYLVLCEVLVCVSGSLAPRRSSLDGRMEFLLSGLAFGLLSRGSRAIQFWLWMKASCFPSPHSFPPSHRKRAAVSPLPRPSFCFFRA